MPKKFGTNTKKEEARERKKQKKNELENKFNEMSIVMQNKIEKDNSKINKIVCNTTHNGIKCKNCFKEPIIGYRYKCSECINYNLCQDCEEQNSISGDHPHNFIKIRKEEQNNNIKYNNNIHMNINNDNNDNNDDFKKYFNNIDDNNNNNNNNNPFNNINNNNFNNHFNNINNNINKHFNNLNPENV